MTTRIDPQVLVERMLGGDHLALARLITLVENRRAAVPGIMRAVHARAQRGYVVGVTGPPGAGKATVVDRVTSALRAEGQTVGIVAVDPSSPFTGGAVLGDREYERSKLILVVERRSFLQARLPCSPRRSSLRLPAPSRAGP